MAIVACDISEFQRPVNDLYEHDWLIFRACDGDYTDKNALANLSWSTKARAKGKIKGFTVYVVYRPGKNGVIRSTLDRLGVPRDCVLMIDAESWGGQISGNHSTEINQLATNLRARQGGRADLVWGYGNRGPDLAVWPNKPSWLGVIVASYGGSKPDVNNMIGWQYTDGQYGVAGLPNSSQPFGQCDHNVLYQLPKQGAVDMPLTQADANVVLDTPITNPTTGKDLPFYVYARDAWVLADENQDTLVALKNQVAAISTAVSSIVTRVAALQSAVAALQAQQGSVTITPTDVPVTGTLHVGSGS